MYKKTRNNKAWESYPNEVLDFLKSELQLGKHYLLMSVYSEKNNLRSLLQDQIHLLCAIHTDTKDKTSINEPDYLQFSASPYQIPIEDDAIDCICIDDALVEFNPIRLAKELERTLRLNSYVLFFQKRIKKKKKGFSADYRRWLKAAQCTSNVLSPLAQKSLLVDFFAKGIYTKEIDYAIYLNWEELQSYTQKLLPKQELSKLKQIFGSHQKDGRIRLEYHLPIYYGLFNKSVPEISLRKNIFFNILRPFAFAFYVLVKSNIYFWKYLYVLKKKLLG